MRNQGENISYVVVVVVVVVDVVVDVAGTIVVLNQNTISMDIFTGQESNKTDKKR